MTEDDFNALTAAHVVRMRHLDYLGALTEKLGVPPMALWIRLPEVTPEELKEWQAIANANGPGAFDELVARLEQRS